MTVCAGVSGNRVSLLARARIAAVGAARVALAVSHRSLSPFTFGAAWAVQAAWEVLAAGRGRGAGSPLDSTFHRRYRWARGFSSSSAGALGAVLGAAGRVDGLAGLAHGLGTLLGLAADSVLVAVGLAHRGGRGAGAGRGWGGEGSG
jgi:hypothetical protein